MIDIENKKQYYTIYKKKKSNGRFRWIYAPNEELKKEQEYLAKELEKQYTPPEHVFGFIKGKSATDLAKLHTNKDWVIEVDIKDFFPSITKEMLLKHKLSEYWCEIATYEGKLVQGSPASPIISNLIMAYQDIFLEKYASLNKFTYSRYADNIILSGNGKPKWEYVKHIESRLDNLGFKLNKQKTKFMFKNQEQKVLGITVNNKPSINHKIRKTIRATIHQGNINEKVEGYISYINSVNKNQAIKLKS